MRPIRKCEKYEILCYTSENLHFLKSGPRLTLRVDDIIREGIFKYPSNHEVRAVVHTIQSQIHARVRSMLNDKAGEKSS